MSKINVNLNHVKRFYSDSETMLKSSIGLKRGEQALNRLAKQIEGQKNEIDKAISENGNQKNKVTSTISDLKRKIDMLKIEIEEKEMTATAGGGAVSVTVNGKKEITKLELKPEIVDPDDIEMLQDLIMVAVNEGIRQIEEMANAEMGKLTGGLNIPGLF